MAVEDFLNIEVFGPKTSMILFNMRKPFNNSLLLSYKTLPFIASQSKLLRSHRKYLWSIHFKTGQFMMLSYRNSAINPRYIWVYILNRLVHGGDHEGIKLMGREVSLELKISQPFSLVKLLGYIYTI